MAFDLDMFKRSSVTGEVSTKIIPCEPGEYPARITRHDIAVTSPKEDKQARPYLTVFYSIDDVAQIQHTGRDPLTVRQTIWLDATESSGLDMAPGKNIGLGRLRAALGQDNPTQPWKFDMLDGGVVMVKVVNEADPKDSETVYDRVTAVRAL